MTHVPNHFFKLVALSLLFLTMTLIPTVASASSLSPDAIGEVVYMACTVHAQQPNAASRKLALESPVFSRDTVITSRYSQVEIRFKDGTILAQGNDAEIALNDYVYDAGSAASKLLFKMTIGTFRIATGEIVKLNPEAFALQTPRTALGIRGTQPFFKIETNEETIGVIDLTPGYTVTVTSARQSVTFNTPGVFTSVSDDGSMSDPAPTPAELQRSIQRTAPMTSKGELGAKGTKDDQKRKVLTFQKHVTREKESLKGRGGKPDYGTIHHISIQQKGLKNAKDQKAGKSTASGGTGISHPDDGHPDDGDDHGDDHGDDGGDHGGH